MTSSDVKSYADFMKVELRADGGGWVPLHLLHLLKLRHRHLIFMKKPVKMLYGDPVSVK